MDYNFTFTSIEYFNTKIKIIGPAKRFVGIPNDSDVTFIYRMPSYNKTILAIPIPTKGSIVQLSALTAHSPAPMPKFKAR